MVKASNVYPKDPEFPSCGVDDMTRLAYLHEPGVLQNLRCRYDINEIYVSINQKFYAPPCLLVLWVYILMTGCLLRSDASCFFLILHAFFNYLFVSCLWSVDKFTYLLSTLNYVAFMYFSESISLTVQEYKAKLANDVSRLTQEIYW